MPGISRNSEKQSVVCDFDATVFSTMVLPARIVERSVSLARKAVDAHKFAVRIFTNW